MESTGDRNYTYELEGDTLIINVHAAIWTMDLVPSWLRDIFGQMSLPDIENVRYIHIEET